MRGAGEETFRDSRREVGVNLKTEDVKQVGVVAVPDVDGD